MTTLQRMPDSPRLSDLAAAAAGRLHGRDRLFEGVAIDTRRLIAGDVFFALHGEQADGHAHVDDAAARGAVAAVVEHLTAASIAQIQVADTQQALQQAGAAWRAGFDGPVIGITGSNGKTTVRCMLEAVLAQQLSPVLASKGNFNNHLGVPLTLLRLRRDHACAVIEMGASHAGEIAALATIAKPQIGVVTNAGDAHLEGFGSRDGVARAKGELYAQLAAGATAIINADDAYAQQWRATASHCQQLFFSLAGAAADISARDVSVGSDNSQFVLVTPAGEAAVNLNLPGLHNVHNALAAAAVAIALDLPPQAIAAGLAQARPTAGRLAAVAGPFGARVVDDSYNANPVSLNAALQWLAQQPEPRWLVLGDMGELGDVAEQAHREAGRQARAMGVECLWATGECSRVAVAAFGDGGHWLVDHEQLWGHLSQALAASISQPPIVLVKGSRSANMDRIVTRLTNAVATGGAAC